MNSGEGGLLTSDDPAFMARAIILSGSYMLYERHGAAPEPAFRGIRLNTPNCSGRMDNLRAAILRPQLAALRHATSSAGTSATGARSQALGRSGCSTCRNARRRRAMSAAPSSSSRREFRRTMRIDFVAANTALGVELKWFGAERAGRASPSNHHSWRYFEPQSLPKNRCGAVGSFRHAHPADILPRRLRPHSGDHRPLRRRLRLKGAA